MSQSTSETESLIGGRPSTPPPPSTAQSDNNQQQPATSPSGYGSIETPNITPTYSWYENHRRNRPQSDSLAAASVIFLSNGMSLAISIGVSPLLNFGSYGQYCWFIAVIIGSCLSAFYVKKLSKRFFNFSGSLLVMIKGIIYLSAPSSLQLIIIARYCDGIAFGLVLIPTILAGSEQSVKEQRGRVLSVEQIVPYRRFFDHVNNYEQFNISANKSNSWNSLSNLRFIGFDYDIYKHN